MPSPTIFLASLAKCLSLFSPFFLFPFSTEAATGDLPVLGSMSYIPSDIFFFAASLFALVLASILSLAASASFFEISFIAPNFAAGLPGSYPTPDPLSIASAVNCSVLLSLLFLSDHFTGFILSSLFWVLPFTPLPALCSAVLLSIASPLFSP